VLGEQLLHPGLVDRPWTLVASWWSRTTLASVNVDVTTYSRPTARKPRIQIPTGRLRIPMTTAAREIPKDVTDWR
jgi:hypothetical protein